GRREHADPTADQSGDADVAVLLDGKGVETLVAGQAVVQPTAIRRRPWLQGDAAGSGDGIAPETAGFGLGDVQRLPIGREPDPVGGEQVLCRAVDRARVRAGVKQRAGHQPVLELLAEVGEPESTGGIEHDVVRAVQGDAIAVGEDRLVHARRQVDALDAAAPVVGGGAGGAGKAVVAAPAEAAVVADIAVPVRPDGGSIRTAAKLGYDVLRTVRRDAQQPRALDLDDQYAAVGQGDRSFGEVQPRGDDRSLQFKLFHDAV